MTGRDDPLGRRALFGSPPTPAPAHRVVESGRRALFSGSAPGSGTAAAAGGPQLGQVRVECGSCGGSTAMGLTALAVQLVPSVWVPLRRRSRLMRCPSCRHLTWCRLSWPA